MIIRSPFPDVEIPSVSFTRHVSRRWGEWAGRPAMIDGPSGRTLTFDALAGGIARLAAGLAAHGFAKGDVFAIHAPNLPEYALAFHGVASAGGTVTTVNPLLTPHEIATQLRDSGARALLTVAPLAPAALAAAAEAGVHDVFSIGGAEGTIPFTTLLEGNSAPAPVDIDPAVDVVAMPYSSGTTGLPKGVLLTHHNLVANVCQVQATTNFGPENTAIAILPFFHIYGLLIFLGSTLERGSKVVTLPRFELEPFLRLIQEHRVTHAFLVPPIILALAKHPLVAQYDLSSLEVITSGAAPLGEDLQRACAERLGCTVLQGFGLTEASPVTHLTPVDAVRPGTIGVLAPNTECRIVDPQTLADVPVGEPGELWIRGPQVMLGYLNQPEATASTLIEGWLRTGDIGFVRPDGYFTIVDRLKEMIKYRAWQVAPAELEAVLLSHPGVADAAVIPSPDDDAGEIPKAFVVRRPDAVELQADTLMEWVAERVAPYKKIRMLEFTDTIPKSASGKILRRVLIEQERAAR